MKTRSKTATILAAALAAAIHSTNAQIITNGSFETPDTPTFIPITAGQNTISPWVVGLVGVDLGDVNNGFIVGAQFDGTQSIDLDGSPGPGQLTQAFATTPGLLYAVTFAYANNYVNQPSASATVRLFDGLGDRLNQTFSHSTSVSGNLDWTVFNGQFTALQTTTSIEFTSLSAGGSQGGILLDGVAVDPELATYALLIASVDHEHARITWPTNATGYALEFTTRLPAPSWTTITNSPTVVGDQFASKPEF